MSNLTRWQKHLAAYKVTGQISKHGDDFNTFKTVAEMEAFDREHSDKPSAWWYAWTRTLTQLYEAWDINSNLRDELDALRRQLIKADERVTYWKSTFEHCQKNLLVAKDKLTVATKELAKPTRSVQDWLNEVARLLGEEIDKHGPYYATAEQYIIQFRAAAKTARIIGADLGHWQGFKFADDDDEEPLTVPSDTKFAIGGKTMILPDGAIGYYGTETMTVKIKDDTLYRALTSLLEDRGQNEGSRADGRQSRAAGEGIGQGPEISASVTILLGGRIRLKLKVGRTVHEIRTYLTAGSPKS